MPVNLMDTTWTIPEESFGTSELNISGNHHPTMKIISRICLYYRLVLERTNKYITAKVVHHQNGVILEASSKEWAIKKQLYRTTDTSAFVNVAKVLAQRCHEMGLTQLESFIIADDGTKTQHFLKTLEANGIALKESEQFLPARPWDIDRPEKPWEVLE